MTTSLTYAYPMTIQGAGMIDIINSKQCASMWLACAGAVHTCVAAIHSYAVHDGLDVASYAWLHMAESVDSPASPNTIPTGAHGLGVDGKQA